MSNEGSHCRLAGSSLGGLGDASLPSRAHRGTALAPFGAELLRCPRMMRASWGVAEEEVDRVTDRHRIDRRCLAVAGSVRTGSGDAASASGRGAASDWKR